MRVLVSGTGGHVGGAVAGHLATAGHEVIGLSRSEILAPGESERVALDIGSSTAASEIVSRTGPCDAIVHAAAAIDKELDSAAIDLTNCLGTQQMLSLAEAWGRTPFVFISGVTVIGSPVETPITESHPTSPLTAYHASKLYGEHLARIAGSTGVRAVSLRLTAPVGPGMAHNRILSVFVRRALENQPLTLAGRGSRRQNYVDVRDVARAVEVALQRGSGIINVAGAAQTSNLELATLCVERLSSASQIQFSGEDPEEGVNWDVSHDRAVSELGYEPRCSITDSILAVASEIEALA